MLLLVFFLFYSLYQYSKRHMIVAFMGGLIVFQISLSFYIEQVLPLSLSNVLIEIWHLIILYILIKPFEYYKVKTIIEPNPQKFEKFFKAIGVMNLISLIIALVFVVFVWSVVEDYGQFKGQPDVIADTLSSMGVSTKFLTISYIFGSTFMFSLALHFYFLVKNKVFLSIVFLILSLSFPMRMLVYFSRSYLILLIILYIAYSLLIYPILSQGSKRLFKISVSVVLSLVLVVGAIITINRFGEVDKNSSVDDKEGTLYQLANYTSMWYPNMDAMNSYNLQPLGGELSDVLFDYWGLSGGKTNREIREKLWPKYYNLFVPFPTVMVFDFGIILTLLISCLLSHIFYKLRPKGGVMTLKSLVAFGVLSPIVLMNFEGCMFEELNMHYAYIFLVIMFLYFSKKSRKQVFHNS